MARNKHPEVTEQKILEVSRRLFQAKGYEHTTIQDIVDALGMSKGAVYHHFKSKEAIYDRIATLYYDRFNWFRNADELPGGTGLEKLQNLLEFLFTDPEKLELDQMGATLVDDPRLVLLVLRSSVRDAAPMLQNLIELGNADGSIHVEQPQAMAESFMILTNLWVGGSEATREEFIDRVRFIQTFTNRMGLPVVSDRLLSVAGDYYDAVVIQPLKKLREMAQE